MKNIFLKLALVGAFCCIVSVDAMDTFDQSGANAVDFFKGAIIATQYVIACSDQSAYVTSCPKIKAMFSVEKDIRLVPVTITNMANRDSLKEVYLPADCLLNRNFRFAKVLRNVSQSDENPQFEELNLSAPYCYVRGDGEFLRKMMAKIEEDNEKDLDFLEKDLTAAENKLTIKEQEKADLMSRFDLLKAECALLKQEKESKENGLDEIKTKLVSAANASVAVATENQKKIQIEDKKIQSEDQEQLKVAEKYAQVLFHKKMAIATAAFLACLAGFFGYAWHTNLSFA